jgi:hypothetical protein
LSERTWNSLGWIEVSFPYFVDPLEEGEDEDRTFMDHHPPKVGLLQSGRRATPIIGICLLEVSTIKVIKSGGENRIA